jgi:hypothetical protein
VKECAAHVFHLHKRNVPSHAAECQNNKLKNLVKPCKEIVAYHTFTLLKKRSACQCQS